MIKRAYHLTFQVYDGQHRQIGFGFRSFDLISWRDSSVKHIRDTILPEIKETHGSDNIMIQTFSRV